MFEGLISLVGVVVLVVMVIRQHSRLGLLERELGALRSLVLSLPAGPAAPADVPVADPTASTVEGEAATLLEPKPEAAVIPADEGLPVAAREGGVSPEEAASTVGPWTEAIDPALQSAGAGVTASPSGAEAIPAAAAATGGATMSESPPAPKKPDIETALGTRWAVWVGGLALALGGIFLIRYSIEAGIFGPGMRVMLAALFGIVLVAAGEFVRRTGFTGPVDGAAGAYVPGILTAAGAFTLFGAVYAAHGIYGFIGPGLAFTLMGALGLGTIAAALVHGQALAGVGLLGSIVTPILVSSQAPNAWALFGYLAIVLVANTAIARLRDWKFLAAAGFVGTGLWWMLYLIGPETKDLVVVVVITTIALASLAFLWLGWRAEGEDTAGAIDWPSIAPAAFVAFAALEMLGNPQLAPSGPVWGGALVVGLVAVALYRQGALPLLYAAGITAVIEYLEPAVVGTFEANLMGGELVVEGLPADAVSQPNLAVGAVIAIVMLAAGLWSARRFAATAPWRAATWAGWGAAVPLVVTGGLWIALGNIDRDLAYAAAAFVLTAMLAFGAEAISRREEPPLAGGLAVSFALAGSGLAAVLAVHMAFGGLLTTILIGVAAIVPALATRARSWPALGWLCVGAVVVVLGRIAFDPTLVGAMFLSRTPVFNQLLAGYGIPALSFIFCAWQLARTTNGRPRLAMEAGAALFTLLTLAMLVRHAMNGGVIDSTELTLAEQAIYTLIALGAGGILIAIDMRSPSSVMRVGSIAAGVVSVVCVVGQHFLWLNPLFTDEPTGKIPFFNLLFLAYLLPAIAAGALAWYSRGKRPYWYSAMLGLLASVLAFAYATLSVRRLFQGEHIGLWAGMGQIETYSYSALWLAIGVGLLVIGVLSKSQVIRVASAALIAIAVAKVFIFDMSELEGVLRALSFIGLGAVLIGIGLFYQRLLMRAAR